MATSYSSGAAKAKVVNDAMGALRVKNRSRFEPCNLRMGTALGS